MHLLVVSLLLCAGAQKPAKAPAAKVAASGWEAHLTPHFHVLTDLPRGDALRLIETFERDRAALCQWLGDGFDPPDREEIVVFAHTADLERYLPRSSIAFTAILPRGRTVLMSTEQRSDGFPVREVQAHELLHQLQARRFPRAPDWVREGSAAYVASVSVDLDGKNATIGYEHHRFREELLRADALPLSELWKGRPPSEDAFWFNASAWRAVRCLPALEPQRWASFLDGLARSDDPKAVWARTLGALPAAGLEARLQTCLKGPPHTATFPIGPVAQATTSAMSRAEVLFLRLELLGIMRTDREGALALIKELLALEPEHIGALCTEARINKSSERLSPYLTQHPDSGEGWACLASVLLRDKVASPDADDAFERGLKLRPTDARLLNEAAWYFATTGRGARAVELSTRAVEQQPWNPAYVDTHAAALSAASRCREAVSAQQRAIELLEPATPEKLADLQTRLSKYEKQRCP